MIVNSKKRLLARKPTLRDYDVQRKIKDRIQDYFVAQCTFFDTKNGKNWYVTKDDDDPLKITDFFKYQDFENFDYSESWDSESTLIKVPIKISSNGQKINVANIAIIEVIPFDKKELLTVTYK
jgi:hypothetical protein|nr:MAG TPA: Protein of unknown function (DUF3781) [Caudoviricetes sp.]